MKYLVIILSLCSFFFASRQNLFAFELYSQSEQQENTLYEQLLSEDHIQSNNRNEEWKDDNPNGSGVTSNTGVAVFAPLGNGLVPLVVLAAIYCCIIKWRKKISKIISFLFISKQEKNKDKN